MIRLIAIGVLAALMLIAPAQAQTWTDRSGRVSLDFEELGWSELPPDQSGDVGLLLAIEHARLQAGGLMRTCFATERRQAGPTDGRLTQVNLNAVTTSMGVGGLERAIGSSATRSAIVVVDDVAVIDASFDGVTQQYVRAFFIKDGSDFVQIIINCGATSPVEQEAAANIARLLQTLRINPERN